MSTTEEAPLLVHRLEAVPASPPRRPGIRLCIVSLEVNGPSRNGGIGTAYTTLAENLAATGHDVSLLYVGGQHSEKGRIGHWVAHFRRCGLRFVPLEGSDVPSAGARPLHLSYLVYRWLARQEDAFDLVHFHEWLGFGYHSLLAKQQGQAFARTTFCVGLHSPSRWIQEANQGPPDSSDVLECDTLERRCVELADVVWSPSRYLLDWVSQRGWNVGDRAFVHPNPLPFPPRTPTHEPLPVRELVFFGRLEIRKGVLLFCDALDQLAPTDLPTGFRVTFLGKPTSLNGVEAVSALKQRAQKWHFPIRFRTNVDHAAALRYLQGVGRLAVMPSLIENCPLTVIECLGLGVPFLASAVGGIPELVAEECHAINLLPPRADVLAERLKLALREGVTPARAAEDAARIDRVWDEWHSGFEARTEPPRATSAIGDFNDLVNLVQAQTQRIEWLEERLRAFEGEQYLRYRVADAVSAWVGKVPLLRPLLKRLLRLVWHSHRCRIK